MKRTVRKKRWARKFIGTHVSQMAAFLLTEGIALYGIQRQPDGSVADVLAFREGIADKWVDEHEWHPNEHFLYKVWYYADYSKKTIPKYLTQAMFAYAYFNHAMQRALEDGEFEVIDLLKQVMKDYDYKTKIRRDPINGRKINMYDLGVVKVNDYAKIGNHSYYKDKILICTEGDTNRAARRKATRKSRLNKKHNSQKEG